MKAGSATDIEHIVQDIEQGDVAALSVDAADVDRNMGGFSILALAFNIGNSWLGISSSLAIAIYLRGTVTLIYDMLLSTVVYFSTALTLAELATVYPTAGGQYHFTSILAPKRHRESLSYACS